MKRSFIAILFLFSFISAASAQDTLRVQTFIRDRFSNYMVDYVLQHAVVVAVDEDYFSDHKKDVYQYSDLKGNGKQNGLRIGDTLFVFNDQPFFSIKQGLYMTPVIEEKVAKHKSRRHKEPKSPEEKARNQEALARILGTIVPAITNRVGSGSYYGSNTMIY